MKIFVDSDFKCHINNDGAMTEYEVEYFDNKCVEFIEGYRFVPEGCSWTRSDGVIFTGMMLSPWKPYNELERAQMEYELGNHSDDSSQLADMKAALELLGVTIDE